MEIKQIKNPQPHKFKRLTSLQIIILIITFPIWIWYWIYCHFARFHLAPKFVNTFHRFGKYDPLYGSTEKYSLDVLTRDSKIKHNPNIDYTISEKANWQLIEKEIANINMVLSTLVIMNPHNKDNKWVIALHGWTENKYLALRMTRHFYNAGYNILTYDARCHGKSFNKTIGLGKFEKYDLIQIIKYLNATHKVNSIGLIGNSMGASTIIEFIKHYNHHLVKLKVKWAISDCGYSSLKEQMRWMSKTIFNQHWFWAMPIAKRSLRITNEININKITPKKALNRCFQLPLLVIHGSKDSFVPVYMAFDIYNNKIKYEKPIISELLIIKDAEHVQSITTDYVLYTKKTLEFAKKHEIKSNNS